MARRYELKRRAERQAETRRRIVDAAVALHASVGEAGATISAIAKRAGVQRLTVYQHFPDERALLTACTTQYLADNPPPDPAPWREIAEPAARLRAALAEVYAFHRRTEAMMVSFHHDVRTNLVLQELMAPFVAHWDSLRDALVDTWEANGPPRPLLRAALGHALDFETWRSLARRQGLTDEEAVAVMARFVRCLAAGEQAGPSGPSAA
jgi:AcrR family transcriptional regulator